MISIGETGGLRYREAGGFFVPRPDQVSDIIASSLVVVFQLRMVMRL